MTIVDIQKRLDALVAGMLAKGLVRPDATLLLNANQEPALLLGWCARGESYPSSKQHFNGEAGGSLDKAEAFVAALPTPEQARMSAFMASLSETIELGKKADIDAEVVNPLLDLMKRISKNAITHAEAA